MKFVLSVGVLCPVEVLIVDHVAPVPPNTSRLPVPVVDVVDAAVPGASVCTRPTVIGSWPKRASFSSRGEIAPLSPRITLVPEPPVIVSLPLPPIDDRLARAERDRVVAAVRRIRRDDRVDVGRVGVGAVPDAVRVQGARPGLSSVPTQVM